MNYILDTGPLVAYLAKRDYWHKWAIEKFNSIEPPLYICEAVVTEVIFLLQRESLSTEGLFKLVNRGDLIVRSVFSKQGNQKQIRDIIKNYVNLPASFADACLVTMAENDKESVIFTLDSDFHIYRLDNGKPLSLIIPD